MAEAFPKSQKIMKNEIFVILAQFFRFWSILAKFGKFSGGPRSVSLEYAFFIIHAKFHVSITFCTIDSHIFLAIYIRASEYGSQNQSTLYYRTMYEVGGAMNSISKTDSIGIVVKHERRRLHRGYTYNVGREMILTIMSRNH